MSGLITPDLSEVQAKIEPGTYHVRVEKGETKVGKTNGTPYIHWTLETINEVDAKNNGRKIWDNTMITGKGAFRVRDFYEAAMGEELTGGFEIGMLLGKELNAVVATGQMGPEVKSYSAIV